MNLKLTNVLSDIIGATGVRIIRDILAGVRDPQQLAKQEDAHYRQRALRNLQRNLQRKALKLGARIVVDPVSDPQALGLVS